MSNPVIQTKQTRRKFDKAFKCRAVELWLSSGKAATEVAAELGIHAQRLSAWRKRFAPPPPGGEAGLVFHSDRGVQYASYDHRHALQNAQAIASMSRKGNCYDNAPMESFWSTLKHELIYRRHFKTRAEARLAIFDFIEVFYNRRRLHSSLGYLSPVDFENQNN